MATRPRIWILSTQRSARRGAMREKMAIFKGGNSVCRGTKIFNGGDVDENRHFIEGKLVAHYQILNIFEWGRC